MPKIIYNETDTVVQFNSECSHKVWLYPKGSLDPKRPDHAEISMAEAKHPNIEKFRQAGKISVLSLEQAHAREHGPAPVVEQKPIETKPEPVVEPAPAPVAETKPEPVVEPAPEMPAEEPASEETDDSVDKSSSKKGKGKRNR